MEHGGEGSESKRQSLANAQVRRLVDASAEVVAGEEGIHDIHKLGGERPRLRGVRRSTRRGRAGGANRVAQLDVLQEARRSSEGREMAASKDEDEDAHLQEIIREQRGTHRLRIFNGRQLRQEDLRGSQTHSTQISAEAH